MLRCESKIVDDLCTIMIHPMCQQTFQLRMSRFPPLLLLLFFFFFALPPVADAISESQSTTSQSQSPQQQQQQLQSHDQQWQIRFDPFRLSSEYRCGAFTEQQGPQKDAAMRWLHGLQNGLIRLLSEPFPHQKLLSDEALLGQLDAWKRSLIEHRDQWIRFDRWWLLLALLLSLVPPLFVLIFLLARCCFCLCRRGKKKTAATGASSRRHRDRRWDWLRRLVLNGAIGILVLANVFCAAFLLLSTQYAQHGLDELPTRLHYCANDLLVYRSETAEQVRKLLRDDFVRFNQSIQAALDGVGQSVVQRLKQQTGVDRLEQAINRASLAGQLRGQFQELGQELGRTLDARHSLQIRLLRLRQARQGLADCERTAKSGDRAALCHRARQALVPVLELATGGEEPMPDWEGEEKPRELSALLPEQIPGALGEVEQLDMERRFAAPLEGLQMLQHGIQSVVDSRREDADERLRLLDRTLQTHYEQISSAIKSVDLGFLDEQLLDPMMRQREPFRQLVQYGWLTALIVSGMFAFIVLAFLLGLCFGCCGRRPSEFDDDDCCVRSTGANFFGCSTWLSLALLSVFGVLSALAMLIGANSAHMVCDPLREPLARPDMLSLADRLVSLYELDRPADHQDQVSTSKSFAGQIFTDKRRPVDLIRGCAQGRTLYSMFELDAKFTLLGQGGPADEYEEMANSIRQSLLSGRLLEAAIGQAPPPAAGRQQPPPSSFGARWYAFSAEMRQSLEALGRVKVPDWEEAPLKEFCAQKVRFQLEAVLAELRRLRQSAEEQQTEGQPTAGTGPVEELESVLRFLEELRPDTVQVRALLESGCTRLEQLRADVLGSLRSNASQLLADLESAQAEFGSEHSMRQKLHAVASDLAADLAGMVRQYGEHINHSMSTEVSSCAPLAEIAGHTRAAICDYALDPMNSLWLALGFGLALLLPTILLASALNPLYERTKGYPKYHVPSTATSTESPINESRFATDIYGLGPASYAGATTLKAGTGSGGGYQPSMCTQITSPYATGNYGYQELGPPVYMGTSRR